MSDRLSIRLLADDLTGALDSAATFGSSEKGVPVLWAPSDKHVPAGPLAFDTGTRELGDADAAAIARRYAPLVFARSPNSIAFKKIDSLLRGPQAAEADAVLRSVDLRRCVIAPAFPEQRRLTRGGRQGVVEADGRFRPVRADLTAALRERGHVVAICQPGDAVPESLSFWNAEDEADLDRIVDACVQPADTLFVGSGGLAAALARRFAPSAGRIVAHGHGPVLALVGTDHPVTGAQLAAVARFHLAAVGAADADRVRSRLERDGIAFVTAAIAPETARREASQRIEHVFADLARALDRPGTLVVSGGETLRALCRSLECRSLTVVGERMPGIPCSIMTGGRWDGVRVVSKSGAFGTPDFFRSFYMASAVDTAGVQIP